MTVGADWRQRPGEFHSRPAWFRSRGFMAAVLSFLLLLFQPSPSRAGGPWAPVIGAAAGRGGALYVLTSEKGGLFVSENGGKRWKNLGSNLPASNPFSLHISPEGRLFIAFFDELSVSSDGGTAWESMNGGGRVERLYSAPGGALLAVYLDSGIHRASGAGSAFVKSAEEDGSYAVADILNEGEGRLRAALFGKGLLFSADGGKTWNPDVPGPENIFPLALLRNPSTGTLFAGTLEGGVFRREKEGGWRPGSDGLPAFCTIQALAADEKGVIWAGAHKEGLFASFDDGRTWKPFPSDGDGPVSVTALVPFGSGVLAGTSGGELFLADGKTGSVTPLFPSDPVAGLALTGGRVLAISASGSLFASEDGGIRWASLGKAGMGGGARFLLARSGGGLFAGTGKGLFISRDGGRSWADMPLPGETPLTALAECGGQLFGASGGKDLFRSSDGTSWQRVNEEGGDYIFSLVSDGVAVIAAGTEQGFSLSLDGGLTWKNEEMAYGIQSLAFDGLGRLWGVSRTGLWYCSLPEGEIMEAEVAGFRWSPLEYFTDIFQGEGSSLYALLGGEAVRLVPEGEGASFTLQRTGLSNTMILAALPVPGGGMLLATSNGFFMSSAGEKAWTEIELP